MNLHMHLHTAPKGMSARHVTRLIITRVLVCMQQEGQQDTGGAAAAVRVSTIDNFQGEEARIIIVSLTRSNCNGKIGFLNEPQRVNVLLSRARDGLILVGNPNCLIGKRGTLAEIGPLVQPGSHTCTSNSRSTAKETLIEYAADDGSSSTHGKPRQGGRGPGSRAETWETVLEAVPVVPGFPAQCERHGCSHLMTTPNEFETHAPDGGCMEACEAELACGHKCTRRCHSRRQPHAPCMVPVDRMCAPPSSLRCK